MSDERRIIVFFSDTHGGHRLGLLRPNTALYDEDEAGHRTRFFPRLTATQEWLWKQYRQDWQDVADLADGDPIAIAHAGDLCQGTKYPSRLVSDVDANQILIATANLMYPLEEIPGTEYMRIISGTASHGFGGGTAPMLVTEQLRSKASGIDVKYSNHSVLNIAGVRLDVAHHGPSPGIRNWTHGNQLRYYVKSLIDDATDDGCNPVDAVVRGHYHQLALELVHKITQNEILRTWGVILPAYCGLSEYSRQATRSAYRIGCGLVAMEIVNGELKQIYAFHRIVDLRTEEELWTENE